MVSSKNTEFNYRVVSFNLIQFNFHKEEQVLVDGYWGLTWIPMYLDKWVNRLVDHEIAQW